MKGQASWRGQVSRSMRLIHSATTLDIRPRDKQLWDRFYSAVTELKMFERKINPLMTFDPQMQREEEARTGAGERLQLNSRKRNSLSMASVASSQGGGSGRKVAEEVSELRSEVAGVLCEVEGSGARLAALERAVLGLTHSLARVEAALGTAPRPSPPAQASLADHFYATRAAALAQAEAEAEAGGGVGGGLAEGSATAEVLAAEPSAASPWSPPTPSHRRHVPLQSPPSPPVQKAPRGRLVVEEVAASTVSAVDFHLSSSPGAVYASAHRPPQPAGAAPGSAGEGGGLGEGWRGQALPSLPHTRQPQGAQSSPTHALPRPYSLGGAGNGATGQWAPQPYASRSTTLLTSPPEWKH